MGKNDHFHSRVAGVEQAGDLSRNELPAFVIMAARIRMIGFTASNSFRVRSGRGLLGKLIAGNFLFLVTKNSVMVPVICDPSFLDYQDNRGKGMPK